MKHRTARLVALSTLIGMLGAAVVSAGVDPVSRRDAARLQVKIDKINKNVSGRRPAGPLRTPVTETELNSYLRYEMGDKLPTGVKDPWVSILGDNRVSGRAMVDLSQVSQGHKSGGMLDPYNYLTGSMPIAADGTLKSKNGVATFALDSASISGVPVPVWMLQEIVTYYSKSPASPQGVAIDKPFALPAGIREIQLDRGQAIVIQ
jgi:hypothetical protein